MQNDLTLYQQKAKIDIVDAQTLKDATSTLSWLNTQLDAIIEDKEKLTKPLNTSLKAIREKYRPIETTLEQAINTIKSNITTYATEQKRLAQAKEEQILADKRTTTETKITKLATLEDETPGKVSTEQGSITFITTKRYRITNEQAIPRDYLTVDETKIKEAMKQNPQPQIAGVEWYEEQTVRNYRV